MGMAASQARYLSLCARMNDIEYQGQQINQQRTTLSNQTTNYYNSLLDLAVPTPPSTKDFTKIEYSGTYAASKFTIGTVTPGKVNGTYNIDLKYTKVGNYWGQSSTCSVSTGSYYVKDNDFDLNNLATTSNNKYYSLYDENEYEEKDYDSNISYGDNVDVFVTLKGSEIESLGVDPVGIYKRDNDTYSEVDKSSLDSDTDYTIKINATNINDDNRDKILAANPKVLFKDGEYAENSSPVGVRELNPDNISNYKLYVFDGSKVREATSNDFTTDGNNVVLNSGLTLVKAASQVEYNKENESERYSNSNDGDFIGKNKLQDLSELISSDPENAQRQSYLEGLKNAFPKEWKDSGEDDSTFLALFEGYNDSSSGVDNIKIVKKSDVQTSIEGVAKNVQMYTYQANGTYEDVKPTDGCQLEFDSDGRIKRIGIPAGDDAWDWVDLKCSETTDDDAYEDAFNQYEYQKYLYDQKQNEINAQISIVQQEDKNLELKLTRLDNERNAVNTELESVKKVVDDNIEKSYKTFSG